ncbi:cell division protein FtsA [Candidatus Avelusimicrobium gallicola]|uniref:Cell division protein FtsA n=1 Tax=Candidatus Avelusimicrobium gallicola TaxID=2562704 RepID=A0A1Y4DMD4_9BACT|nr:cell division protein FtsA [Elusimicrobium sp. An273]OUO56561.1 cell division protein FtsA [Elusimicrobium sp. An273]
MAKTNIIAGLDVGSGKLTCIAAAHDFETNTLKVLAGRSVPCKGLRGGMVSDIRETSAAVTHILGSIERECNQEIGNLFVGVRGAHLESFSNHGTYNISRMDKEITQADMDLAIENAKAMPIKNDNEIINVIPQGYAIDKQKGITNPEGMEGSLLEVDVHITTGSSTHLNNLAKAIQRPGYKIDGTFYSLVPLADTVLTQEEKEIGALILDLGGETMSVGIYIDGILKFSRDIPYGCDLITSDLSRLLHTSRQNAKEIKEKYGVSFPTFLDEEGEIPVPSLDGRSTHNIKKSFVLDIIQPRVEELIEQVALCVENSGYKKLPVVGVVTGGGSLMPGITEHCVNILGLKEARRGVVQRDLITSDDEFFDPLYSTAMALAIYASDNSGYDDYSGGSYEKGSSFFGKLGKLFKGVDIFGG